MLHAQRRQNVAITFTKSRAEDTIFKIIRLLYDIYGHNVFFSIQSDIRVDTRVTYREWTTVGPNLKTRLHEGARRL